MSKHASPLAKDHIFEHFSSAINHGEHLAGVIYNASHILAVLEHHFPLPAAFAERYVGIGGHQLNSSYYVLHLFRREGSSCYFAYLLLPEQCDVRLL